MPIVAHRIFRAPHPNLHSNILSDVISAILMKNFIDPYVITLLM